MALLLSLQWLAQMFQPLCRFGPWEYTAVGRGLITVPGIVITLYGVILIIYISRHIYANFLAALAGLVGNVDIFDVAKS
jgi:hypothetical protein